MREPLVLDGFVPYPADVAEGYRRAGYWTDETLQEPLFASVARHPERTAVVAGDEIVSYGELGDRVLRVAAGVADLGVGRGDRVVVHLPNVPSFIVVVYALWELGAVPTFAPAAHRRTEITQFVELTEARAYVTVSVHDGADLAGLAAELTAARSGLRAVVLDPDGGGPELDRLLAHTPLAHERRSSPQDVALLQTSGGTTGRPKLIPHTHETYGHSVRLSIPLCGIGAHSVQLIAVPVCHSMAVRSPGFLGVLAAGGTVVLAPDGSPDTVFPLIERHGVTQASVVPPLLLAWLNSSMRAKFDLSSLHSLHVGGAKLSAEAARRVRPELGAILQQGFGMAEGLVNYNRLDVDDETSATCQGLPVSPGDELLVLADDGTPVAPGTPGHLLTRGPSTIRGYFRAPELNAASFTEDGYYRTGDIVARDERGYLTVVGRSKDQINRGGEKVAPEEVENLILALDGVHDVSVIGIADRVLGERVKAYVVPRDGVDPSTLTLAAVRRHLRERGLAAYKMPDALEVVAEFPRTAMGKISKLLQRQS
ncbi:(2,3-dihydroxybenzoyl)adenylate synthase [Pseudonocardia sulfidoxydans]|uniref:(2,3-dihydroxybenzoyl)adenylate synthase n=1 Tax=Pseudonocardia sulfidoxydans TaxID=54011 RepID=UPI0035E80EFE